MMEWVVTHQAPMKVEQYTMWWANVEDIHAWQHPHTRAPIKAEQCMMWWANAEDICVWHCHYT